MYARVESCSILGMEVVQVEVEVNTSGSLPGIYMVGLPDAAVRESYRRIKAAVANSELLFCRQLITVNLAPAHLRKEGSNLDLPIALAILSVSGALDPSALKGRLVVGELALDGKVRGVRGALAMALWARRQGREEIILPAQNLREAARIGGIRVTGVESLRQALDYLQGEGAPEKQPVQEEVREEEPPCLSEVKGQTHAKRALEIAAAGFHNLLLVGPPGSGKSMLAERLPGIMPPLEGEEVLEVASIHSVAGILDPERPLSTRPPFRSPHHSISHVGLVGGGKNFPRPGEITLSHHGVLFLDELPEFKRDALEVLRQPMESGKVSISRSLVCTSFPARFLLVAGMNPCPCGYLGDSRRACSCAPSRVRSYYGRVSGPLLDRIDLQVEVPRLGPRELVELPAGERSEAVRERVIRARERQRERWGGKGLTNASVGLAALRAACRLGEEEKRFMFTACERLGLTARGFDRCLRVARTIADLAGRDRVGVSDLAEAVQYRTLERLWGSFMAGEVRVGSGI
ncbi:MAG: YifB family Mg chelatase-like AAA ATPase [Actinobacteria bacterium]|nr:YifB family Mg chelatase-like AAA ATPase [Actinomycetota bacterium]MDI6831279.1 YifB family Mg chelatase-like AAA ATPase [Actinomycetota bacterium]